MRQQRTYTCACARTTKLVCLALLLLCAVVSASAQKKKVVAEPDTVPLFRGVQVSYDLMGTIMRAVSDYGQYEAAVRVNLKDRFFPTAELGYGSSEHNPEGSSVIHASTNAPYFRIGCDLNVAKKKHDDYRVFIGLRYGFTAFTFKADAEYTDPVWGNTVNYRIEESGCNYHWGEFLFGVDAKICGPLRLGWTVRYRMPLSTNEGQAGQIWYVPGFGKRGNKIGGTFNVIFELGNNKKKKG